MSPLKRYLITMSILLGIALMVLVGVWYFYQYQTVKINELRKQDGVDTMNSKTIEAQTNLEIN